MMDSKIVRIVATKVVVPTKEGYVDRPAFGEPLFDKAAKWMIELFTDSDLFGYGETPRAVDPAEVQSAAHQVLGKPLSALAWGDPIPPNLEGDERFGQKNLPVPHRLYELDLTSYGGEYGVGIAVQDLLAKAAGMRLCNLIGGAYRQWVPTNWWMGRSDSEHAARQMELGLKLGFNAIKIKAAAEDDILGIVRAIKHVGTEETGVIIDPNRRFYRLSEAIQIARQLEGFKNIMFEDPFPFDIDEWQLFRQKTTIPVIVHSATSPQLAMAARCCDHINLRYPNRNFLGDAHMASRFGMLSSAGSGIDLGILDAFILHYSVAAKSCVLPGDAVGHCIREDDLIEEPFEIRNGQIKLPEGLGLGVALDHKALKRFATDQWEASV